MRVALIVLFLFASIASAQLPAERRVQRGFHDRVGWHLVNGNWDKVDCGDGDINLPGLFRQLQKMGYMGACNLEYERNTGDKLPGMLKSMAYMRGIVAGLSA